MTLLFGNNMSRWGVVSQGAAGGRMAHGLATRMCFGTGSLFDLLGDEWVRARCLGNSFGGELRTRRHTPGLKPRFIANLRDPRLRPGVPEATLKYAKDGAPGNGRSFDSIRVTPLWGCGAGWLRQEQTQPQIPPLRCGMTNKKNKQQQDTCGDSSLCSE
jgi:hypothetical protein